MTLERHATLFTCAALRQEYKEGQSPEDLADDYDLDEMTVRYHLYGHCEHEIDEDPVTPAGTDLSEDQCAEIRTLANKGHHLISITNTVGVSQEVVVDHATGFCEHEGTGVAVERRELYARHSVDASDCAELRRKVDDTDEVLILAENTIWNYNTVLTHVNGDCSHSVAPDPREKLDRTPDSTSESVCRELRDRYRESHETTIQHLADQYDYSEGIVEKHITFECNHPPADEIVELLEAAGLSEAVPR